VLLLYTVMDGQSNCNHKEDVIKKLEEISVDLALSLRLVRVLTLLPIYDPGLDEVERHVAHAWDQALELQQRLDELTDCDRGDRA
jgi:hypothetical protein